jgi:diadenosine tetraphosphate (Ap4A) HIT family hydrolase
MGVTCPFCELDAARIWLENAVGIALHDAFPVSEGHTLVIPRKHVARLFDLSPDDQAALWQLVAEARQFVLRHLGLVVVRVWWLLAQASG